MKEIGFRFQVDQSRSYPFLDYHFSVRFVCQPLPNRSYFLKGLKNDTNSLWC